MACKRQSHHDATIQYNQVFVTSPAHLKKNNMQAGATLNEFSISNLLTHDSQTSTNILEPTLIRITLMSTEELLKYFM